MRIKVAIYHVLRVLSFCCLLCSTPWLQAQEVNDELKVLIKKLKSEKNDTSKVRLLDQISTLAPDGVWEPYNAELKILAEALSKSENPKIQHVGKSGLANALNNEGYYYDSKGDKAKALDLYNQSLELRRELNDKIAIAQSLNNIAALNEDLGNINAAINNYKESLYIRESLGDQKDIAESLNNLGYLSEKLGDYPKALDYHKNSLSIREKLNDHKGMSGSLINIGRIYDNYLEERRKATEFYRKSLVYANKAGDKRLEGIALDNIGVAYRNMIKKNHTKGYSNETISYVDSALFYFRKSLTLRQKGNDERGLAFSLSNLGELKQLLHETDSALWFFERSLALRRQLNDKRDIAFSLTNLAGIYYQKGQTQKALSLAEEAYTLAKQTGFPENIKRITYLMHELAVAKSDYKTSLEMYKTFILMRDSIQNQETKKKLFQKQYQLEYELKARSDSLFRAEEDKVIQARFEQEKTQRYALGGGLIIVIVAAGLLWNRFRVTQKQKVIIEMKEAETQKQKLLVEKKNEEILSSIEYAKRIQSTILPSQAEIEKHLSDSFVLYLPKDIVAGDFYWLGLPEENHGQSYVFVGACDSTGHGVPGALVSVVCSKALEKSFHEFKIDQPASLLDKVSELVTADFARNNTEGDEIKDGMDASIIKIFCDSERTHVNAKIVWAGANNPLVYVLPDGTLHEIKADKQPVGKTESIRSFTQHELELPHGTMVYLFTDGYSDQFGGTEGKKLTKKVFKDLLKKCFNQPGKEQRVFLKKFIEEYRGKEEQVDDICVIGVRVNR